MKSKLQLLGAMGVFGTIGIFRKFIPLPSATIAFVRGALGVLFLILVMLVTRKKPAWKAIRNNLLILILSGVAIGFNWVLLFESYNHTTVAISTICYYMAPLFLLIMSPLLGERLTGKKLICIATAFCGMILLSLGSKTTDNSSSLLTGILLATGAAVLYATVMLLNKKLSPIPAYDKTIVQLGAASLVLIPYLLLSGGFAFNGLNGGSFAHLAVVGIVHTGIAYTLYFDSMRSLPAHTIAIFSYLDPVLAVALSAWVLHEPLAPWGWIGAVLILGSALYSELPDRKR